VLVHSVVRYPGCLPIELATRAAEQDYDLLIAYGGDGTINHVVNGVMGVKGKGQRKAIGVIPGGTANQWASESSVPVDPVKAALALIDSNLRTVDLGRLQVQAITFPNQTQESQQQKGRKARKSKAKQASSHENYFLLTAGQGIDAAVISHTSKGLKQRIGPLAFDLAVAESLPEQHPFPIEGTMVEDGKDQPTTWSGEAYQVILGNTRRYANAVELTPDVYLDDGKLELCVITSGNTITTLQQISSLLFRHKPDTMTARHFLASHFLITVPASIHMHLDGSAAQLEDYLNKSDREALLQEQNREHVMVTYRFDAIPHAVQVAIPTTYDGALFEKATSEEKPHVPLQEQKDIGATEQHLRHIEEVQNESRELIATLLANGHQVSVKGVASQAQKQHTYIIAGTVPHRITGDTIPVAVCVDESVTILKHSGEHVPSSIIQELQAGAVIVAAGKKSKYGVIRTSHIVI
jgi:diacylglycerol kinase family enzyme